MVGALNIFKKDLGGEKGLYHIMMEWILLVWIGWFIAFVGQVQAGGRFFLELGK